MFSSKTTEHIGFLSRQLATIAADGDLRPALAKLKDACPEQYRPEVDYLEGLLQGNAGDRPSLGHHPYKVLARLMAEVPNRKNDLLRGYIEYLRQSRIVFETYWAGVVSMVWYLTALAAIMLVISVIFGKWTIPAFHEMFTEYGAELPALTSAVFAVGGAGLPMIAILVAVFVALIAWSVATFHRRIQRFEPLPKWPPWVPLVGGVARYYNLGLLLNFGRVLIDAGATPEQALRVAARESNQGDDFSLDTASKSGGDFEEFPALTELAIASRIGNLEEEIAYQCEEHLGKLSLVLIEARDRFSLLLKVVIYSLVALLVIAMYLPIFRLGSVI